MMGTWNFGESEVTEGVKVFLECTCGSGETCDCYFFVDDIQNDYKAKFESLEALFERKINDKYKLVFDLRGADVRIEHGYYDGLAIDYDENATVVYVSLATLDNEIVKVDNDELEEYLYDLLDEEYIDVPCNLANYGSDTEIVIECLAESDKDTVYSILREHANAVLSKSQSVGWVTCKYETEVAFPSHADDTEIITMFCNLPK